MDDETGSNITIEVVIYKITNAAGTTKWFINPDTGQRWRGGGASYCGMIGSQSKRRQFEKRFHSTGVDQALVDQLICPIGVNGIRGKTPKEIAIAVAAEILQFYDRERFAFKQEGEIR